jgi:adenine/guanine phosphoribosyltransferase-like PRPP-binding protein
MILAPHEYWQELHPPGRFPPGLQPCNGAFVACLPDGRQIVLPVRVLPGAGTRAVASLIVNQASFAVLDALLDALAARVGEPEVVIGLPTLGLPVAEGLARRLGHRRYVALGTSAKFWYDERLSEPLRSITTPGGGKRLFLDPRMVPLLQGRRLLLVDDVVSTGASIGAALRLLARAGLRPEAVACCMAQGPAGADVIAVLARGLPVHHAIATPLIDLPA